MSAAELARARWEGADMAVRAAADAVAADASAGVVLHDAVMVRSTLFDRYMTVVRDEVRGVS